MILHTVNKSPFDTVAMNSCLAHCKPGSSLLLIEDGIYAALKGAKYSDAVTNAMKDISVYVLSPDLEARGVQDRLLDGVKTVDYAGFVDLSVEHDKVQAWL